MISEPSRPDTVMVAAMRICGALVSCTAEMRPRPDVVLAGAEGVTTAAGI